MKKYIIITLLMVLLPMYASAKALLDDYHIEIEQEGIIYTVKEQFVAKNVDNKKQYVKSFNENISIVDTNIDDYTRKGNIINFYMQENKNYFISYEVKKEFTYIPISDVDYNKVSVFVSFDSIDEMNSKDIKTYSVKTKEEESNTIFWSYENIEKIPEFSIKNKNNKITVSSLNKKAIIIYFIICPLVLLLLNLFAFIKYKKSNNKELLIIIPFTVLYYILIVFFLSHIILTIILSILTALFFIDDKGNKFSMGAIKIFSLLPITYLLFMILFMDGFVKNQFGLQNLLLILAIVVIYGINIDMTASLFNYYRRSMLKIDKRIKKGGKSKKK